MEMHLFVLVVCLSSLCSSNNLNSTIIEANDVTDTASDVTYTASDVTDTASDATDTASDATYTASDVTDTASDVTYTGGDVTDTASDVSDDATRMTNDSIDGRDNSTTDDSDQHIIDKNNYIEKISAPITTVVGIVTNTATLVALKGTPFSAIPSSHILSSLAVADTLTLVTVQFHKKVLVDLIGKDVRALSNEGCKLFFFVVHFAKMLSAWFVVLICIERFVVICFPFHAKGMCTKTSAFRGIAVVIALSVVYSGIWTLSTRTDERSQCNPSFVDPQTRLQATILIVIGSALIGIVPMAILIVLTPVMCLVLYKYRNLRKGMTSSRTNDVTKTSSMLITLCVTYVILQLPLIVAHNMASNRSENVYTTKYVPLVVLYKVGNILESINYSCNFFLYIACNRMFRLKILSLFQTKSGPKTSEQTTTEIPISGLGRV